MKLIQLFQEIKPLEIVGNPDIEVRDICIDSRLAAEGSVFVAVRGTQADGHTFIPKALEGGAAAIVCEDLPATRPEGVTMIRVESTEAAVGVLATRFFGNPTKRLKLVGVTGTNGKTTIATLLYKMFRAFGHKTGLCSTVCNYVNDEAVPTDHTTPDPITLNRLLGRMADEDCEYAFMEVSSHSIHQKRIGGLRFCGGIFTNLTRDHLDYHKTFENYRDAKKKFFDDLPSDAFALTNADDKNGMVMLQNTRAKKNTYSARSMADFRAKLLEMSFEGMLLEMDGQEVSVPFVGKFNVSNLLAVYGAAVLLGKPKDETLRILSTLHSVSGRFETLASPRGYNAIVDYAHTPDALVNVLSAIHEVLQGKGHVLTVCGAGGNRDKGKRPLMAREAVKGSDKVIITSDNPRFEEPMDIINDMLAGLDEEERANVVTIPDRHEAIRTACMMAQAGDVILVAGKGHENYQDVKGVKHHFDDKEELLRVFAAEKK